MSLVCRLVWCDGKAVAPESQASNARIEAVLLLWDKVHDVHTVKADTGCLCNELVTSKPFPVVLAV